MIEKYYFILSLKTGILILWLFTLAACNKTEGEGGTSTIEGVVIKQNFSNAGQFINEFPSPDEKVYIIYGEKDNIYNDEVRSHFDGRYRFDFLKKGKYQLFAYSECKPDTCPNVVPVFVNVEITESNQIVNAPTLYIKNE